MPNIKISDLNRANRLSDEALIVVVQDKSNKTITVKDLADKINSAPNHLISKLNEELKRTSQGTNVIKLKDLVAKQEFRLNKIDEVNKKQDLRLNDLEKTNKHLENEISKSVEITKKNIKEAELTRKGVAFINSRIEGLTKDIKLNNKYVSYMGKRVDKVNEDLTYQGQFIHFSKDDYWGTLNTNTKID